MAGESEGEIEIPGNGWFQRHVVLELKHMRSDHKSLGTKVDGFMATQNSLNTKFTEKLAVQGVKIAMFGFIGGGIGGALSMIAVTLFTEYMKK